MVFEDFMWIGLFVNFAGSIIFVILSNFAIVRRAYSKLNQEQTPAAGFVLTKNRSLCKCRWQRGVDDKGSVWANFRGKKKQVAFDFFQDTVKLALIGGLIFLLLERYLRWKRSLLAELAEDHRMFLMLILGAVLVGIKVSEEALSGESGPMDKAILLSIHQHVPTEWTRFFQAVTLMGSFDFVIWLLVICGLVFIALKRWPEVLLLAGSVLSGGLVIYVLKLMTGRDRPALWETRWYWGTSFPSGHTLETAAFAMALTLCLKPIWPRHTRLVRLGAMLWVLLVGWSRLVLGVHWPTDVLAAACIGMVIPVGLKFLLLRLSVQPRMDTNRHE